MFSFYADNTAYATNFSVKRDPWKKNKQINNNNKQQQQKTQRK